MKQLLFILIMLPVLAACSLQPRYTITGTLADIDQGRILLEQMINNEMVVIDSAEVKNGQFSFSGSVTIPDLYYMRVVERRGRLSLFIENSKISITGHADSLYRADVTGSAVQEELQAFNVKLDSFYWEMRIISGGYQLALENNDEEKMAGIQEKLEELDNQMTEVQNEYVSTHTASYISPYIIRNMSYEMEVDQIEEKLLLLDEKLAESQILKELWDRVGVLKRVAVGQMAPDFTQDSPGGVPLSLSSLKGNILLVDFWAAWCGPCRRENPNVVNAYKKYHEKGFDILGVSLDDDRDDWLQAIQDDGLTWNHVSDLKGWANEAAALYGVNAIPHSVLLDRDGKIIDRNLRGGDLHDRLAELLD